jgi:hypothetical protein
MFAIDDSASHFCARDARHLVHREDIHLALRERIDELRVLRGLDVRDERAAFTQLRDFLGRGRPQLQDDVAIAPRRHSLDDGRARGLVLRVGIARFRAGAALDLHEPAALHPLRHDRRRCGDPALTGPRLLDDA